ncbi:MAG: molybdopterin-dependent oxidoreductase [Pirellulaceae bacterium]
MRHDPTRICDDHLALTRRYFMQIGVAGVAGLNASRLWAVAGEPKTVVEKAIAQLSYLTPHDQFKMFGRGDPPPHTLSPEKRREVGLTRDTWQLEVIPDPAGNSVVRRPRSKELGTALNWQELMTLADKHAVRVLHVMSCTNMRQPCGMGLWEGVPLREVLWLARPESNVRRVFYYGYHNDDPKQRFQSSLPIGRALEDPPGEHPPILCYKLNDQWLTPKAGAPVRMIVPDRYGNKSVKWLQRIVLTNRSQSNDTYAEWNNDTDSHLKTCARFIHAPKKVRSGQPMAVTGLAQVGMSGFRNVQTWLCPQETTWPQEDPYFFKAPWRDADVLPPPEDWGGGLAGGTLPPTPGQVDPETGKPHEWPLRGTIIHWATLFKDLSPGRYHLRCRTIDANEIAQPMPRPFLKSGHNAIQTVPLIVVEKGDAALFR